MLSSEAVEKIRAELLGLYMIIEADVMSATTRTQTVHGNLNLSCVQRMLDLLPPA